MNTAIQALPTYIQEKVSQAIVPVKYTAAVKALAECRNLNEAKYFSDKADALAAWAKIYQHDEAAIEAKRLKLHAFRRMGILAEEIQPTTQKQKGGKFTDGRSPGSTALLMGMGLGRSAAGSISALGRMSDKKFNAAISSKRPRSPSYFRSTHTGRSKAWQRLYASGHSIGKVMAFMGRTDPKELARGLTASEATKAKEMATEMIEWLDTFDQYLPSVSEAQ